MNESQRSLNQSIDTAEMQTFSARGSSDLFRANRTFHAGLSGVVVAFGAFVWTAFFTVPPPNPWMMGETAFTRILILYAVAMIGSIAVCVLTLVADWRLKTNWYRWLAIPFAAYLLLVLTRAWFGLPLSIG